jgi:hypothetical protein
MESQTDGRYEYVGNYEYLTQAGEKVIIAQ